MQLALQLAVVASLGAAAPNSAVAIGCRCGLNSAVGREQTSGAPKGAVLPAPEQAKNVCATHHRRTKRTRTTQLAPAMAWLPTFRGFGAAVSSLYRYCIERLGYAEDAALKRHRVAKLALRLPQVLQELRAGTMHLTGLFLISTHLNEDNVTSLLSEARGKSRRQVEELIARWFPRADVPASLEPVDPTCSGAGDIARSRLEPLSPTRLRVQFTARAELYEKLERARELLSHAVPNGDLGELFERALDALIVQETRKRFATGKARKPRNPNPGSRHVPAEIERAVWDRDNSQCTFVDGEGRRCSERRFLTIEHRTPFALGGLPTLENLCLLCSAHNLENARHVFGEPHIETKIRGSSAAVRVAAMEPQPAEERPLQHPGQVLSSLSHLGFRRSEASAAVGQALGNEPGLDAEQLLRKCLLLLVPKAS